VVFHWPASARRGGEDAPPEVNAEVRTPAVRRGGSYNTRMCLAAPALLHAALAVYMTSAFLLFSTTH